MYMTGFGVGGVGGGFVLSVWDLCTVPTISLQWNEELLDLI